MKKIYDSVHGFIRFNDKEELLIDSLPFQRLHLIHQLGCALFVYPGATHKRFEHSLGTMEIATRSFDHLFSTLKAAPHTFKKEIVDLLPQESDLDYWRQVVRFAALCHDLGHLPFSHIAEKALLKESSHEEWTAKMVESDLLKHVWEACEINPQDVVKIAIGPKQISYPFTPLDLLLTEIITGDFFGADRIDYLLRDAKASGLPYGLFDHEQIIEMMRIIPDDGRIKLGIEMAGIEACESLLLARYFMHKRIYQYPSIKAYGFHMAEFMCSYIDQIPQTPEEYIELHDMGVISSIWKEKEHPHAKPFHDRKKRFMAIPTKEEIVPGDFACEINTSGDKQQTMNFPVIKNHIYAGLASDYSETTAPLLNYNWIFVPREEEQKAKNYLSQFIA